MEALDTTIPTPTKEKTMAIFDARIPFLSESKAAISRIEKEAEELEQTYQDFHYRMMSSSMVPRENNTRHRTIPQDQFHRDFTQSPLEQSCINARVTPMDYLKTGHYSFMDAPRHSAAQQVLSSTVDLHHESSSLDSSGGPVQQTLGAGNLLPHQPGAFQQQHQFPLYTSGPTIPMCNAVALSTTSAPRTILSSIPPQQPATITTTVATTPIPAATTLSAALVSTPSTVSSTQASAAMTLSAAAVTTASTTQASAAVTLNAAAVPTPSTVYSTQVSAATTLSIATVSTASAISTSSLFTPTTAQVTTTTTTTTTTAASTAPANALSSGLLESWWKTSSETTNPVIPVTVVREATTVTTAASETLTTSVPTATSLTHVSLDSFWKPSSPPEKVDEKKEPVDLVASSMTNGRNQVAPVPTASSGLALSSSFVGTAPVSPSLTSTLGSFCKPLGSSSIHIILEGDERLNGVERTRSEYGGNTEQLENEVAAHLSREEQHVIEKGKVPGPPDQSSSTDGHEEDKGMTEDKKSTEKEEKEEVMDSVMLKYMKIVEEKRKSEKQHSIQV